MDKKEANFYFERWDEYFKIEYYRKAAEQYILAQLYWYWYNECDKKIKKCVKKIINNLLDNE